MAKDISELKYKTTPEQRAASLAWAQQASEKLRAHELRKAQRIAQKILSDQRLELTAKVIQPDVGSVKQGTDAERSISYSSSKAA